MTRTCCALLAVFPVLALEARADWAVGTSYQLSFINFPVDGAITTTLDQTTKTVNTNLTVKETIYADGPNSAWIDFYFSTIDGTPIASNLSGTWRIDINGVQTTEPAMTTGYYVYWTVDGTPVSPLSGFGGFTSIAPIPTDPDAGNAFVNMIPPEGPKSSFDYFAFLAPYNYLGSSGASILEVNGFHAAIRVNFREPDPVPSPSAAALGVIGTAMVGLRRRTGTA